MPNSSFDDRSLKEAELQARQEGRVSEDSALDREFSEIQAKRQADEQDRKRILAAREGDPDAFTELVRRYWRQVYLTCYRLVWNKDEAERLVGEAFDKVWASHERLNPDGHIGAYLNQVARNHCIGWLRREKRQGPLALSQIDSIDKESEGKDGGSLPVIEGIDPASVNGEKRILYRIAIERVMRQLSDTQQRVFQKRFVEGYSRAEIAKQEECTEANVGYHERRAIAVFRDRFLEEWGNA